MVYDCAMRDSGLVHAWFWELPDTLAEDAPAWSEISAAEAARARRFVFAHHAARYVWAHARMRALLGACLDRPPLALRFEENDFGKPRLAGEGVAGLHFNLSHSEGYAALAVRWGAPVGVDIECVRPVEAKVATHFFSPAENAVLSQMRDAEWLAGFYRCWTRKEAILKADGQGLAMKLDTFDVTLTRDDPPALLRFAEDPASLPGWRLLHFEPAADVMGAVALPDAQGAPRLDLTIL
jgi:4'-phosphopantetheinyl transferase